MKNLILIIFLLLGSLLQSCDSQNAEPEIRMDINFDLSNAKAIVIQGSNSTNGRTANTENTKLFKVDGDGNISSVVDSVIVTFARTFSQGLYVEILEEQTSAVKRFYVLLDNSYVEIEEEIKGTYIGENENGDLIFSDVSILRAGSITVDKLQTTLDLPIVQSISGDLAVITDNSVFQIFNTVSNIRYNVNGCNGPRIEAFNGSSRALIDDCSDQTLINMSDGSRTEIAIHGWNHEPLRISDGIVVLSQSIGDAGDFSNFALGHIDQDGNITVLTDRVFQPGSFPCMTCGYPNSVLFGTDEYLVVRELNKISVVDRSNNNSITSILDGFNVTKMSLHDNLIYYLAEDNLGNPTTGVFNILNAENQILDNKIAYDDIQTF